jgi:hypothetical protein
LGVAREDDVQSFGSSRRLAIDEIEAGNTNVNGSENTDLETVGPRVTKPASRTV